MKNIEFLENETSNFKMYPRAEGNNIMTWVGFKHIMYLAEESVFSHFRKSGLSFRELFEEYGLVLEIVSNKGRILTAIKLDEEVSIEVHPSKAKVEGQFSFDIKMFVNRENKTVKSYTGRISVVLRCDDSLNSNSVPVTEKNLVPFTSFQSTDKNSKNKLLHIDDCGSGNPSLTWKTKIPYTYCHGNERLKMSGYLRYLEHVDLLFCDQQNISINTLLKNKHFIPAVSSAEVSIFHEAYMEEELIIEYGVIDIVKDFTYKSIMNCYANRDGEKVLVARGIIVHAYAKIHDRKSWAMVSFDKQILSAIRADV